MSTAKKRVNYSVPWSYKEYTWDTQTGSGSSLAVGIGSCRSQNTVYPSIRRLKAAGQNPGMRNMDYGSGGFYSYQPFARHITKFHGTLGGYPWRFVGDITAAILPSDIISTNHIREIPLSEANDLTIKGVNAIAKVNPLNPVASAAVALGELRHDGLPKVPGMASLKSNLEKRSKLRSAGEEHLNLQFAVAPMLSDVSSMLEASRKSAQIMKQLRHDSGRWVRRRYEFPLETKVDVVIEKGTAYGPVPATVTSFYSSTNWTRTTTTTVTKKYRFSGAFTYYLPTDDTFAGKIANDTLEAKRLYGLSISPEVAWNLAPWSWAVDWMGNAGKNITNLTRFAEDGLVMPYAYIMCETTHTVNVKVTGGSFYGYSGPFESEWGFKSKSRLRATPFGFGLNDSDLTARQWSIIGALGLTKAPGKLP